MYFIKKTFIFLITTTNLCAQISFEKQFQQANDLFQSSQYDAAIKAYNDTIALNDQCHQAYFNLGLVYAQQNNHEQAIQSYLKAFALCDTYIKALVQAGNSYQELKKYDSAIALYKKGLAIDSNAFDCAIGIARALHNTSNFEDSALYFKSALKMKPHDTNIMLELANTLNMAHHTHEALDLYYKMLTLMPQSTSVLYNIAYTLKKLNRVDEALPFYEKVLALDPHHTEAHFGLGLAHLGTGNFAQGWEEYEWRWKRDTQGGPRVLSKPLWDGSSLDNKTILLHAEQGLGDTLQFIRYAHLLKSLYAVKIIFATQDPLIPLMKLCPYLDHVTSLYAKVPFHDVQAPLLSMPYIMKTRIDSIPHTIPYLYADERLVRLWEEKLNTGNFKIGICWQGNSNYSTHFLRTAVAAKSVQLQEFMPLLTMKNITVYNLQKSTGEEQAQSIKSCPCFVSFDKTFDEVHGRFMDTAAVIKNLDLMITVDTSIAHLAGGLGVPTWVLLPEPADWRWMIERTDTPWYPTMRLFRQPKAGDWKSVIQKIIDELRKLMGISESPNNLSRITKTINNTQEHIHTLEQERRFDTELERLSAQLFSLVEERKKIKLSIG